MNCDQTLSLGYFLGEPNQKLQKQQQDSLFLTFSINSYTLNQHLDMEIKVMILLNFKFYTVTPSSYIHVLVQVLGLDDDIATVALYMTSLSMMESDSIGVKPSLTAAAAGKNKQTRQFPNPQPRLEKSASPIPQPTKVDGAPMRGK